MPALAALIVVQFRGHACGRSLSPNVGALIIPIGFWGILCYNYNSMNVNVGPYMRSSYRDGHPRPET